ncbi:MULTISPECIES: glycosyltransferase family 2 protein [environmental samples]|uniref:glycosyltransferase family 2 protein n=1 Tax=environmental samples TaxID=134245 RepID=UPI00033AECE8|nr:MULTISPECIES: glycosyltransferase family 2 protein [environmental samples]CCY09916.1 putative uncharacterized protein [Porphyromonas sp. CAG:1061]
MNTTKLLSIIIPAYNVAPYIGKCLDSCLNQDIPHEHYEIIVVDDGSKDDTALVVKQYCNEYPNISYHYQENAGQGVARNVGLSYATGEYIWFVDSDDWIRENCINSLLDYVRKLQLDICLFPVAKVDGERKNIKDDFAHFNEIAYSLDEFAEMGKMTYSPCNYLFLRVLSSSNNICFLSGIYHEDIEFNTRLIMEATRIGHYKSSEGLYYYRYTREGSTMNNRSEPSLRKHILSLFIVLKSMRNTYTQAQEGAYKSLLATTHNSLFLTALIPIFETCDLPNKDQLYREYAKEYQFEYLKPKKGLSKVDIMSPFRYSLALTTRLQRTFQSFRALINHTRF